MFGIDLFQTLSPSKNGFIMRKLSIIFTLLTILLSGCSGLEKSLNDFNESMASLSGRLTPEPIMVSDTAERICSEAKKNEFRAKNTYVGKGIVVQGSISSNFTFSDTVSKTFSVNKSDGVSYSVNTGDIDIEKLSKGDTIHLKGKITGIFTSFSGCTIFVSNAVYNN